MGGTADRFLVVFLRERPKAGGRADRAPGAGEDDSSGRMSCGDGLASARGDIGGLAAFDRAG